MTRTFGQRVEAKKQRTDIRVGRINTLGGVASELARVYRGVRHKKIESTERYRLSCILTALAKCLEASEVEHRLDALEDAVTGRERFKVLTFTPKDKA
jgi:hypothetical protein